MPRRQIYRRWFLQCVVVLVPVIILITLVIQKYNQSFQADWRHALSGQLHSWTKAQPKSSGPCLKRDCPDDQFSFFIHSGAANVVHPKICLNNDLVLGTTLNNAGVGINIVVANGKTGKVTKTGHFDMYAGDVKILIEFLSTIEAGSVVLIASFDEPASKLDEEAKKLFSELGSTSAQSLGFRDNWVFVGGKGATVKSAFEKHMKNDREKNLYDGWPELIELKGCIPKYMG